MKKIITGMAIAACLLSACKSTSGPASGGTDSAAMKLEKNKQTALNSLTALIRKDIDGGFKDYSSDFTDYGNGESKPMKLESVKAGVKNFFAGFPDYKGENLHAIAEKDTVIVTGNWSGTFKNEFMNMKPNGKIYKVADADIYTFDKDGKITSHRSIQSDAAFTMQLEIGTPSKK